MTEAIYTVLIENGTETAYIFDTWEDFNKAIFSPAVEVSGLVELGNVTGRNYAERKEAARTKAVEYSSNLAAGLSYGEVAYISNYFERIGRRYGLLAEFRENCIC